MSLLAQARTKAEVLACWQVLLLSHCSCNAQPADRRSDVLKSGPPHALITSEGVLQAHGVTEGVGFSDPSGLQQPGADEDSESPQEAPSQVPAHYTLQLAQT